MSIHNEVLFTVGMPVGDSVHVIRRRFVGSAGPRVAIVAGIRGDTPEGVRVAHAVAAILGEQHENIRGSVDVFPCVNPVAASRGVRRWPFFNRDLNRCFPGTANGPAPDHVAWTLVQSLRDFDQIIELRGAHPAFAEAPQAHVRAGEPESAELARHANVNVVWARTPGPAAPSTFAWQFARTIALEGGSGNCLTPSVGQALTEGVLNMLNVMGVLPDEALPFHWAAVTRPRVVTDAAVHRVRLEHAGLFLPKLDAWAEVEAGDTIGVLVSAGSGEEVEVVRSPVSGNLLAVREHPVVVPGSVVARVAERVDE